MSYMKESCITYEGVVYHIWRGHVSQDTWHDKHQWADFEEYFVASSSPFLSESEIWRYRFVALAALFFWPSITAFMAIEKALTIPIYILGSLVFLIQHDGVDGYQKSTVNRWRQNCRHMTTVTRMNLACWSLFPMLISLSMWGEILALEIQFNKLKPILVTVVKFLQCCLSPKQCSVLANVIFLYLLLSVYE